MRVLTLLNQKGGVGKTSTTHHLAGAFSKLGRRVLLIDNDPQSSLTQGFFGPDATRALDPSETIAALYAGECPFPDLLIRPTRVNGVELMPGSKTCTDFNVPRPRDVSLANQTALRRFVREVQDRYDTILIDCPPNLHLCSWAALVASDDVIIPLQPEDYAAQGIADVLESIEEVKSVINPHLNVLGMLVARMVRRKTIHRLYDERLRDLYGDKVFKTVIPDAVAFVEAIGRRLPIEQYQPRCDGASSVRSLAAEILERAEGIPSQYSTFQWEVA